LGAAAFGGAATGGGCCTGVDEVWVEEGGAYDPPPAGGPPRTIGEAPVALGGGGILGFGAGSFVLAGGAYMPGPLLVGALYPGPSCFIGGGGIPGWPGSAESARGGGA
jgi:hypothetical protein